MEFRNISDSLVSFPTQFRMRKKKTKHKVLMSAFFFSVRLLKEKQSAQFHSSKARVYCVRYFWNVLEMLCLRDWGRQGQALFKKLYEKRKMRNSSQDFFFLHPSSSLSLYYSSMNLCAYGLWPFRYRDIF